ETGQRGGHGSGRPTALNGGRTAAPPPGRAPVRHRRDPFSRAGEPPPPAGGEDDGSDRVDNGSVQRGTGCPHRPIRSWLDRASTLALPSSSATPVQEQSCTATARRSPLAARQR